MRAATRAIAGLTESRTTGSPACELDQMTNTWVYTYCKVRNKPGVTRHCLNPGVQGTSLAQAHHSDATCDGPVLLWTIGGPSAPRARRIAAHS